jgi:transcriptional regulator with XRE-family HTH domain
MLKNGEYLFTIVNLLIFTFVTMKSEELLIERVLYLMEVYSLTPAEFAERVDVQRSSISHLMSRRNKPSLDFIQKVLNHFPEINPNWLVMGIGPMKQLDLFDALGQPAEAPALPNKITPSITDVTEVKSNDNIIVNEMVKVPVEIPAPSNIVEPIEKLGIQPTVNVVTKDQTPKVESSPTPMEAFIPMADTEKKIIKVMFFYSDNTFDSFKPNA